MKFEERLYFFQVINFYASKGSYKIYIVVLRPRDIWFALSHVH